MGEKNRDGGKIRLLEEKVEFVIVCSIIDNLLASYMPHFITQDTAQLRVWLLESNSTTWAVFWALGGLGSADIPSPLKRCLTSSSSSRNPLVQSIAVLPGGQRSGQA
jgi:hypothetical protein